MKSPIFSIIRQRLVARVDDGAIELHPLINVVDDVISTLAELKIYLRFRLRRLEIKCQWIRLTNATRARKDLSGRQKRKQCSEDWRRELRFPFHQIILVATKRGPGVMIDVVL